MTYDVQIGSVIRRGIPFAELIMLPIVTETFVRRGAGRWMRAKDCLELSHILINAPTPPPCRSMPAYAYSADEFPRQEEDDLIEEESFTEDEIPEYEASPGEDNRLFIPSAEYFTCKQKRKAAIIGVCTLGLAALSLIGVGTAWRSNIFEGTSFSANEGLSFVLKCLSFCLVTALLAVPYFIYSVIALIYYSIRLHNLSH